MITKISKRIKKARIDKGITQAEAASLLGVSLPSISRYEQGHREPDVQLLHKMSNLYGVPLTYLIGLDDDGQEVSCGAELTGMVPLISWVQAGNWTGVVDNYSPGDGEELILTTKKVGNNAFALRVTGDSMEPEFREGETIIVDPDRAPANGSYVIARIDGGVDGNGEATFKRLIWDGGRTYLKPINDRYPLMDMTGREFRIVGVVVEKRKEY